MSNALTILRSLIIYSLCLPLAIFLGYLLAMPMDAVSFTIVVSALCLPLVPLSAAAQPVVEAALREAGLL